MFDLFPSPRRHQQQTNLFSDCTQFQKTFTLSTRGISFWNSPSPSFWKRRTYLWIFPLHPLHCHNAGEKGNPHKRVKLSTNLLLRILHSSHGGRGSSLHSHGVALGAGRAVGLPRVGAALLRLRVRVIAHAVQLRSLHHHWIHRTALLVNTSKEWV